MSVLSPCWIRVSSRVRTRSWRACHIWTVSGTAGRCAARVGWTSLDQWSRPLASSLEPWSRAPLPMPSRTVKPAGKAPRGGSVSWGRARLAPSRIVPVPMAAARCSRAVVLAAGSARSGKSAGRSRLRPVPGTSGRSCAPPYWPGQKVRPGCTRLWPGLHGFAEMAGSMAADIDRAGQAGARRPQPGRVPGAGGIFPAPVMVAPTRGLSAPGTACGRGWRGTGLPQARDGAPLTRAGAAREPGNSRAPLQEGSLSMSAPIAWSLPTGSS